MSKVAIFCRRPEPSIATAYHISSDDDYNVQEETLFPDASVLSTVNARYAELMASLDSETISVSHLAVIVERFALSMYTALIVPCRHLGAAIIDARRAFILEQHGLPIRAISHSRVVVGAGLYDVHVDLIRPKNSRLARIWR